MPLKHVNSHKKNESIVKPKYIELFRTIMIAEKIERGGSCDTALSLETMSCIVFEKSERKKSSL